jgi:hypothetical protein
MQPTPVRVRWRREVKEHLLSQQFLFTGVAEVLLASASHAFVHLQLSGRQKTDVWGIQVSQGLLGALGGAHKVRYGRSLRGFASTTFATTTRAVGQIFLLAHFLASSLGGERRGLHRILFLEIHPFPRIEQASLVLLTILRIIPP